MTEPQTAWSGEVFTAYGFKEYTPTPWATTTRFLTGDCAKDKRAKGDKENKAPAVALLCKNFLRLKLIFLSLIRKTSSEVFALRSKGENVIFKAYNVARKSVSRLTATAKKWNIGTVE